MPTYTYRCPECMDEDVMTHSMFDTPDTTCDECNVKMRKVFHATPAVFKGEGFYTTDKAT